VPSLTPSLPSRRRLLITGAAAATWPLAEGAAQSPQLPPTPRQTTGPFYPVDWTGDVDGDLVRVTGEAAAAQGVVTHLRGRVLDVRGVPVPGAIVEIWQCDAFGRYRHPRDRQDGRDGAFKAADEWSPPPTEATRSEPFDRCPTLGGHRTSTQRSVLLAGRSW
jgi:protocatechuate 3,4-dioxygenase beta subunit